MVLDGCSEGTEHYIGVSAAYTKMDKTSTSMDVPVQEMLSVRLLLVDATKGMTAAGHLQHIMLNHVELNGKGCGKQRFLLWWVTTTAVLSVAAWHEHCECH